LGSGEGRGVLYRTFPKGVKSEIYPITVTAQGYEYLSDEIFSDLIKLNVNASRYMGELQRAYGDECVSVPCFRACGGYFDYRRVKISSPPPI